MPRECRSVLVVVVVVVVGTVLGEVGGDVGIGGGNRRRALPLPFTTTTTTAEEGELPDGEAAAAGQRSKLVVPDLTRVDSALLKQSQADKFLSLWYIYVLDQPVQTSNEPWTLLVPKNEGLPRGGGFLTEKEATMDALLNHVILGEVLLPPSATSAPSLTLGGTNLNFASDEEGVVTVNGVRLTGEEHRFNDGVVYILESALPSSPSSPAVTKLEEGEKEVAVPLEGLRGPPVVVKKEGDGARSGSGGKAATTTRLPPLTHRFATFKPRRRPSTTTARPNRPVRPSAPRRAVLQPVFGEEPLEPADPLALEPAAGSGAGGLFEEVDLGLEGSAAPPPVSTKSDGPFLPAFLSSLEAGPGFIAAEFLHHFHDANITERFRDTGRYTALVPHDAAFYSYYPIDWGFNPFLVHNFTKDVLLNHFVRGNIDLDTLPALAELTTLGGRVIKFTRRGGKLLANGVEVMTELEKIVSRGRIFFIDELLFVDYDRVFELQSQHGDLETAPLLGTPWPSSQFLSHLLGWSEEQPDTSLFAEYLNHTNLAYLVPGHDEDLEPLKYTAFIPTDEIVFASLYADAPDPFLLDKELRDHLVLSHLVSGRFYEDDLRTATTLTTLANTTLTVTITPEGEVEVDGIRVITPHTFLYNLGNVYLVEGLLGVTDEDIFNSISKFSSLDTTKQEGGGNLVDVRPYLNLNPGKEEPQTSPAPTTPNLPPAPPPTTTTTTTTTTTRAPLTRATSRPSRFTSPRPSPTTPRIRFETRTEISISRRVNDGAVETVERR